MFKELGEFIDNVGRATGRMIGQILSDKDDDGIDGVMGNIEISPDDVQEWLDFEDSKVEEINDYE